MGFIHCREGEELSPNIQKFLAGKTHFELGINNLLLNCQLFNNWNWLNLLFTFWTRSIFYMFLNHNIIHWRAIDKNKNVNLKFYPVTGYLCFRSNLCAKSNLKELSGHKVVPIMYHNYRPFPSSYSHNKLGLFLFVGFYILIVYFYLKMFCLF